MKNNSERNGTGVTGLSISVISDEFRNRKDAEITPEAGKDAADNRNGTELPISSQQQLVTYEEKPRMLTQVLGAIVVAMTHLGIGAIYGFPGVTLPQLTQPDSNDIYLNPNNAALFGSLVNIGAAIGSVGSGLFLVRFGQRVMLMVALPTTLSIWILHAFAPYIWLLLLTRFLLGLMTGLLSTSANTYIMEIAHKDRRGRLFAILPTTRQLGYLFVAGLGSTTLTWRYISLACGFVTTLPPFLGLFFFPNSPRWLVTRGRVSDAKNSLTFFRGREYNVKPELKEIVDQVDEQQNSNSNFFAQLRILGQKSALPNFLIIICLTIMVSYNGSFVIVTYLVPIFQASSSDISAYTSAILVGAVRVVGTLVSLVIIDRLGRRPLLIFSYIANCMSLTVLGGYFYAENHGYNIENLGWLPLTSLLIYTLFVSIAVPVTALLRGELLPTSARAAGYSVLITAMFSGGFVVTLIYPQTTLALGEHGAFWIYGCVCALVAIFTFFVLPETSGRSLEEITKVKKNNPTSSETDPSQRTGV